MNEGAEVSPPLLSIPLNAIAEPARGGYKRYLGWTMSLMPLPGDWARAVTALVPIAERAMAGEPIHAQDLLAASLDAYRLSRRTVEPLISWTHRT